MLRTFIAVPIVAPPPVRKIISKLNLMGGNLRPVTPDQLHVTLKFVGDTDEQLLPQIDDVIRQAAAEAASAELRLVGTGVFPDLRRPAVLWIGMQPQEPLSRLASVLEAGLEPLGFAPERRNFHPHITLLRIRAKPPEVLRTLITTHAESDFGSVRVEAVELFQSELGADRARHTRLSSHALRCEAGDLVESPTAAPPP